MKSINVGRLRVTFSTRARWSHIDPDGIETWHRAGIALCIARYGMWGVESARVFRVPLTPKTYAGEVGPW